MLLLFPYLPPCHKILFLLPTDKPPVFGACKRLDIELEMVRRGFFSLPLEKH